MRPVFVNSVPKSGTYLCAAILQQLGVKPTWWHIRETCYEDYRGVALEEARSRPELYRRRGRLEQTVARIPPGHFAVGHLRYNARAHGALRRCCLILLRRDLRQCLVSHMVWRHVTGRDQGAAWTRVSDPRRRMVAFLRVKTSVFLQRSAAIEQWEPYADLSLTYDELPHAAERIAGAVGCPPRPVDLEIETLTRIPHPPWREFWSPEAERIFTELSRVPA